MKKFLPPIPVSPPTSLLFQLFLFLPGISSLSSLPIHWANFYPFQSFNYHILIFSIWNNSWNIKQIHKIYEWMNDSRLSVPTTNYYSILVHNSFNTLVTFHFNQSVFCTSFMMMRTLLSTKSSVYWINKQLNEVHFFLIFR